MVTIAVDAMGGDHAPDAEIAGAVLAAKAYPVRILLTGREETLRKQLERYPGWQNLPIEVVHASEVITMEDSAAKAVRAKKDSSIRVASRLVRDGRADGVVTAGNTGAAMATAKLVQGMIHGVERPALASALPTVAGRPVVLLDVGANVDSTPRMLAQFALMGELYARFVLQVDNPRVGLLSIGEEDHKGNELTRAASALLKSLNLNFIGNVEGRDIYKGTVDVVVCDGFTGNVALKVSEGVADFIRQLLRESFCSSLPARIGALLCKGAFHSFRKRVDYSEYGGAPLLGVRGVCIITHGRSNANGIKNAIRVAAEYASGKIDARIESELVRWNSAQLAARAH